MKTLTYLYVSIVLLVVIITLILIGVTNNKPVILNSQDSINTFTPVQPIKQPVTQPTQSDNNETYTSNYLTAIIVDWFPTMIFISIFIVISNSLFRVFRRRDM